jgi:hypothetical protein
VTGLRLLVALLCVACAAREAPAPAAPPGEAFTGSLSPPPASGAEVVAIVDGERIYAADVERVMAARGASARAALDELIGQELLAAEARRRGLLDDPEVVDTRRRERVRALLRREFEPSFDGPEDIPAAEVEEVWRLPSIRMYYDHDRYHGVAYVRAELKKDAAPEAVAAAQKTAETFRALAVAARPETREAFFAVAAKLPPGQKVSAAPTQFYQTSRRGPAVEEFARAAMALEDLGDISPPVRTPWGWDVLYLAEIIPERRTPREEALLDIRKNRFEAARRLAYQRWVDGFLRGVRIERNEALLDRVQVDSLVGMQ